jgi:hypothetical protein
MAAILVDALLVLVLLAVTAYWVRELFSRSSAGLRYRQVRNRRRIEQESGLVCPVHGRHAESELVRLPSGETLCPQCYQEIQNADVV